MDQMFQYFNRVGTFVEGCYVNICHKYKRPDGKVVFPGAACATMQEAIQEAIYWANKRDSDVYLAMGAYISYGDKRDGRLPYAIRQMHNVSHCKCLYMDVDVDTDPKKDAYRTVQEMEDGIEDFYHHTNIPRATITVNSGRGGRHLYWPFNDTISPNEWSPLAHALASAAKSVGLKFDPQCTTDLVRLLRVPRTWNFKNGPKGLPVTIEEDQNVTDDPKVLAEALANWWADVPTIHSSIRVNQDDMADDLGGGIGSTNLPANIDMVAKECGFIANALANHGARLAEPLWKHTISISCHTTDPEGNAHRLSSGHHAYSPSETDEKLRQAQRDRQLRKSLGPPHCAVILADGATECKTCKHRNEGTVPTSFGYGRNGHSYIPVNQNDPDLPYGYWREANSGHIYFEHTVKKEKEHVCVFPFQILPNSAYLESATPYQFVFTTKEAGRDKVIKVNQQAMSSLERAGQELGAQGMSVNYKEPSKVFFMGFLQQLRSQPNTMINLPAVGWHNDGAGNGFAFAGNYFSPAGVQKCKLLPPEIASYGVIGDVAPWTDLANVVITRDRPDLSCLVAQGFASPLVIISGHSGYLFGAWSTDSGVGKSTALTLAQAIWGSPIEKNGLSDTEAHIFSKASTLKNIGVIFDEMKTISQQKNFLSLIFQITMGSNKGRADRSGNMRAKKEFNTLLAYATNASMVSAAEEQSKGSYATIFRMFEFASLENTTLKHSPSEISRMTIALNHNYGGIGLKYAQFLGENYDYVSKCVKFIQTKLETKLKITQEERYWTAAMANTLAAAHLAKKLGVAKFHLDTMEAFMIAEFHRMRGNRSISSVDYGNVNVIIGELGVFLKEHRARNTVITDVMLMQTGRPAKGSVKILNEEPGVRKENVTVHIALKPLTIRISDASLGRWCTLRGIPKSNLVEALDNKLGARKGNARIASGTIYADVTEPCWTIPVVGTQLEQEVEYVNHYKP